MLNFCGMSLQTSSGSNPTRFCKLHLQLGVVSSHSKLTLPEATQHFCLVDCDFLHSHFSALQIPEFFEYLTLEPNKSFWWILLLMMQNSLTHLYEYTFQFLALNPSFIHNFSLLLWLKKKSKQRFSIFKKPLCNNLMIDLISVCISTSLGLKSTKTAKSTQILWFCSVAYRKG